MGFIMKSDVFFKHFEQSANNIYEGARVLVEMLKMEPYTTPTARAYAQRIKDIEHNTDKITHETINIVDRMFITSIDREDVHSLITTLDDVMDFIDGAAGRLALYDIKESNSDLVALATILHSAVEIVKDAIAMLQHIKDKGAREKLMKMLIDINTKENESDHALRVATSRLFTEKKDDPVTIIKLKEIYENIETATDRCEDVANIIEEIILKNA